MVIIFSILAIYFAFFAGYYFGYTIRNKRVEETIERVVAHARQPFTRQELKPGAIRRPTAEHLHYQHDEKYQERQAIKETLDQIPELREQREHMELAKKLL